MYISMYPYTVFSLWAEAGLKMNYDSIGFILGGYKEICMLIPKVAGQPNPSGLFGQTP